MKKKHLFAMFLAAILAIIAIISTTFIIKSNIFNQIYLYTGLLLMWVLILLAAVAIFHNDKKIALVGKITVVVMISAMLMLTYLFHGLNDSLNNFKQHNDVIVYSIYAKDETQIDKVGILELGNQDYLNNLKEIINSEYPSAEIRTYDSVKDIDDALKLNKIDTMICLNTYDFIAKNYGSEYVVKQELKLVNRLKFENERSNKNIGNKDAYVLYLSTNESDYDTGELAFSTINKLIVVNKNNLSIDIINIPYNYYLEQTCLDNKKDIIANAPIYGLDCSIASLEKHFDTKIDYYLRINLTKLAEILDKLGGVEVNNPTTFTTDSFVFKNGILHLDGHNIIEFLTYKDDNSYRRENEILKASLKKMYSLGIVKYIGDIDEVLETNLGNAMISDLLNLNFKITYTTLGSNKAYDYIPTLGTTGNVNFAKEDALKSVQKLIKTSLE